MKINVKCLYAFKLRGERIMFKHSLDIEAAFSGKRARNPLVNYPFPTMGAFLTH